MTFNVAPRDRMSQCQTYSNLYSIYPEEAKLKEARMKAASVDVIESDSTRLERKLTERFLKGSFEHEGANIRFVKTVGKFIFVAVMFPPYMIAYQIPKWVIQYALPFVADNAGILFNKVGQNLASVTAWVAHVSGIMLEQFNKYFLSKLKIPAGIAKSSQDMLKRLFKRLENALSSTYQKIAQPIEFAIKKVEQHLKKHFKSIKEWATPWIQKFTAFFKHIIKALTPSIKLPSFTRIKKALVWLKSIVSKGQNFLAKVKAIPSQLKEKGKQFLAAVKKIKVLKTVTFAIGSFLWDILESNYDMWIAPCIRFLMPIINAVSGFAVKQFMNAKATLIAIGEKIAVKSLKVKEAVISPFKIVGNWMILKLKALQENVLRKIYKIEQRARKLFSFSLPKPKNIQERFAKIFQSVTSVISNKVTQVKMLMIKLPQKAGSASTKASLALIEFFKQVRIALLTFFIFIKLALRQGFIYLSSLTRN